MLDRIKTLKPFHPAFIFLFRFLLPLTTSIGTGFNLQAAPPPSPNVIIIFADDLGYGDLGCFGHPTIHTPHLDQMASEGQKWTQFYAAASVCTPSRAGLMTGRLPIRSGMCSTRRRVLFPDSSGGLPASEITVAEVLKSKGYATQAIGKWHLGHLPAYLPTRHGFDHYYGIPYSNDMDRVARKGPAGRAAFLEPRHDYWDVPLLRDECIIERPADQNTITRRYTQEAVRFIEENQEKPFFLYLAHNLPHVPLFVSPEFKDTSARGLYGDVVEEIDASVGKILSTLKTLNIDSKTLVVFTSDNGPWLPFDQHGGSAGLLRGGKGATWEGGMREPTLFWWPGTISPGVVQWLGSTLDLLPTVAHLAHASLPEDRILDGFNLAPTLLKNETSPRNHMIYYFGEEIYAARIGSFKAHYTTFTAYAGEKPQAHTPPLLFNLDHDPSEKYPLPPESYSSVFAEIDALVEKHKSSVQPVPNQLIGTIKN